MKGRINYSNVYLTIAMISGQKYLFRSKEEAYFAAWLETRFLSGEIKGWLYEGRHSGNNYTPVKVDFPNVKKTAKVKRTVVDFWVMHNDGIIRYIELKGRKDPASVRKDKLMKERFGNRYQMVMSNDPDWLVKKANSMFEINKVLSIKKVIKYGKGKN